MPAENLSRARQRAGLTQQQLADRLRVNRVTVGHIESGERRPSLALAVDIARVLGVSLDELVEGGGR